MKDRACSQLTCFERSDILCHVPNSKQIERSVIHLSFSTALRSTSGGRIFARRVDLIAHACPVQPLPPCVEHSDAAVVTATSLSWWRPYCEAGTRILGYIESTKIWKLVTQTVRNGQTQQRTAPVKGTRLNVSVRAKDSQSFQRAAATKSVCSNLSHRLRDAQMR